MGSNPTFLQDFLSQASTGTQESAVENKDLMTGMLGPYHLLFTGMPFSPTVGKSPFPFLSAQEGQCEHTWKGKGRLYEIALSLTNEGVPIFHAD